MPLFLARSVAVSESEDAEAEAQLGTLLSVRSARPELPDVFEVALIVGALVSVEVAFGIALS
jgi:hypothetical protein